MNGVIPFVLSLQNSEGLEGLEEEKTPEQEQEEQDPCLPREMGGLAP